jgi:hypothetical protein
VNQICYVSPDLEWPFVTSGYNSIVFIGKLYRIKTRTQFAGFNSLTVLAATNYAPYGSWTNCDTRRSHIHVKLTSYMIFPEKKWYRQCVRWESADCDSRKEKFYVKKRNFAVGKELITRKLRKAVNEEKTNKSKVVMEAEWSRGDVKSFDQEMMVRKEEKVLLRLK